MADVKEKNIDAIARKITKDDLHDMILNKVKCDGCVLGQGSYGTVYKAEYNGIACAVKQVDIAVVTRDRKLTPLPTRVRVLKQNFLLECLLHSKLSHPNIVKMLGVFYPKKQPIPVLVMELMECNLTQLLERTNNIIMYVKLSILQDVSRGLCYLHTQNPPIVHQALYSDNILVTKGLIAKIGDFKTGAKTVSEQALLSTRLSKDRDFLPYSINILKYDMPLNVFSFGCVICHVMNQKWPITQVANVPKVPNCMVTMLKSQINTSVPASCTKEQFLNAVESLGSTVDDWSTEKHQGYIDLICENSIKQLAEACLQRNPKNRPHMSLVYESITNTMTSELPFMYNIIPTIKGAMHY